MPQHPAVAEYDISRAALHAQASGRGSPVVIQFRRLRSRKELAETVKL